MMKTCVAFLVLLACVFAADDQHRSGVRNRQTRDTNVLPTGTTPGTTLPNQREEFGSQNGEHVQQGPEYTEVGDPYEQVEDQNRSQRQFCRLEGTWYNALGSEMILNVSDNGVLSGEYRTAVEKGWGSAGQSHSVVVGHSGSGSNPSFGFTVVWNEGESVTSWAGQCMICEGEEILQATWVLSTKISTCQHEWMSDRVGQDTFRRDEQSPGPRKSLNTHTPRDYWRASQRQGPWN